MNEQANRIKIALDDALSGIGAAPDLYERVLSRHQKEDKRMKGKISFGVVVAAALLAILMGTALAAAAGWDVMRFLFGGMGDAVPMEPTSVAQSAETDGAAMRVEAAVYDGRTLAFDWSIENTKPAVPMYARVERFTANGVRLWTDGSDSFDEQWLPGFYGDSSWQDGELILLPDELVGAEALHVEMQVKLYRPERPVYQMKKFNAELAAEKAREGYYVIAEGDGWVYYDVQEQAWSQCYGGEPPLDMGGYRTEELGFTFDVKQPSTGILPLTAAPFYENEDCTAQYETAEITPLGLYLSLKIMPKTAYYMQQGMWCLTDESGVALYDPAGDGNPLIQFAGESFGRENNLYRYAAYQWYGMREQDLPDVISLSWLADSGERMIFPVRVRE